MELGDGSAVRLTVARYYTPTGRSIQRPYGDGNRTYYNEYEERYLNGELIHEDSIKVADLLRFLTPKENRVWRRLELFPMYSFQKIQASKTKPYSL